MFVVVHAPVAPEIVWRHSRLQTPPGASSSDGDSMFNRFKFLGPFLTLEDSKVKKKRKPIPVFERREKRL